MEDSNLQVIILSAVVSVIGGIITIFVTKWMEIRQTQAAQTDETKGALALEKFKQEENIRVDMQRKIERLERAQDRNERGFTLLRDSINDILRETVVTMQLAIYDLRNGRTEEADKKLEEGIARIRAIKLPELPHVEEHSKNQ